MVSAIISITASDVRVESHFFFLENIQELISKELTLAKNDKELLRPLIKNNIFKNPRHAKLCKKVYARVRNNVQRSTPRSIFWNEKQGEEKLSFVGMLKVFSDETTTILKVNGIVAYPVHVELLKFTRKLCRFLIDHGDKFVALFLVCVTTDEQDERQKKIENS